MNKVILVIEAVNGLDGVSAAESHRREVTVVFIDLRGFTSFSDAAEPEEVMGFLRDYHAEMGRLVFQFEGTLEHYAGDGISEKLAAGKNRHLKVHRD